MNSGSLRLGVASAIALLVLVLILQNTEVVDVRFLFWELRMSRVVLMVLAAAAGFVMGFVVGRRRARGAGS